MRINKMGRGKIEREVDVTSMSLWPPLGLASHRIRRESNTVCLARVWGGVRVGAQIGGRGHGHRAPSLVKTTRNANSIESEKEGKD